MLNTQTRLPRSSTWLFSALLVAFGSTSAAAQHGRRDYDRDYRSSVDTTFSFDRRGQVSLTLGAGDIVVTGWSRDQIRIHATSDNGGVRLARAAHASPSSCRTATVAAVTRASR